MTMKKLLALLLVLVMVVALVACGGNGNETEAPTNNSQPASDATEDTGNSDTPVGTDLKVAVFYYTYSDTYISSVRTALDAQLDALGVTYQDFDSNGNQTTQNEAIQTAIADGYNLLIVNMVTSGSSDTAKGIMELAGDVPVIFFNRAVDEDGVEASASVLNAYENIAFVGTDAPEAGHLQGKMVGEYLLENYDTVDLNGDGVISYVMFKGQEGNAEAEARTQFGVEDANAVLTAAGKPELAYYNASATDKYLVDQGGKWSAQAANDYMATILPEYSEANGNMVELIICNNDGMAEGAVSALQGVGYNTGDGKTIPVFGVDATDSAKQLINEGKMTGTIKQDAEGMAAAIAQIAKAKMATMEEELCRLPTKKAQKEYIKQIYHEIKDEYTPVLKHMTRTQGRVLLKLIDRETEYTAYEVLKEFRGGFVAGFWQGVSKIFGQNLKSEYDREGEDRMIEQIVIYYEAGLLR